jgi:two-component system sensor histidine kinase ChiS
VSPPTAQGGRLELSGHAFATGSAAVELQGAWRVKWDTLMEPGQVDPDSTGWEFHPVPGLWNDVPAQEARRGGFGCATFVLDVRVPDSLHRLGMVVPEVMTAGRLWANGRLVATNGRPGSTRATTVAGAENPMAPVPVEVDSGRIRLVYQIANFESDQGGMSYVPRIGAWDRLVRDESIRVGKEFFLVGVLLLLGLYHLWAWLQRRHERTALPLGLFCLLWSFRFLVEQGTGQRLLTGLLPGTSYATVARLEVVPFYLTVATLLHFFSAYFQGLVHRRILRFGYGFSAALLLVVAATPPWVFGRFLSFGALVCVAAVVLMVHVFVRAVRERREGAVHLCAGFAVFAVTGINDLLQALQMVHTGYWMDWGVLALALANTLVVARRHGNAFLAMERHAGELSRLDRIKDDILANTGHELRTPLHGIVGIADAVLARSPDLPESVRSDLGAVSGSARRLAHLVNDILDFSRLRQAEVALPTGPVEVGPSVDRVLLHFREEAARKGLELRSEVPGDLPLAEADADRLDQILFNLVGNALKHTDTGAVGVAARAREGRLELDVRDSGTGIAAPDRARIFEPFEQGSGARRGGTGLGLPISRRLAQLMGGSLEVESEEGKGSVFRLSIPVSNRRRPAPSTSVPTGRLQRVLEAEPVSAGPREARSAGRTGSTILVVDDEPLNLRVLQGLLEPEGHRVVCESDPRRVVERVESERPRLVLLDVSMPERDGYAVCRELREHWSASELPVVFVTARDRSDDLVRGYEAGGNDYLIKPILREELRARVDLHLAQQKAYGSLRDESNSAAETMQAVVALWEEITAQGRADFAERSGLWKVQMDADGWRRTQTLDKYLDPAKVPRQPRWAKVRESARWILELAEREGVGDDRTRDLRERLERLEPGD